MIKNILKELRNEYKFTQEEVAKKLNIEQSAYSRMEKLPNLNKVDAFKLNEICKIYKITVDEFMKLALQEINYKNDNINRITLYFRGQGKKNYIIPENKQELVIKLLDELSEKD